MGKRFYLPAKEIRGGRAVIQGEEAHHIAHVMRMKPGDRLIVFDGEGREYEGTVREIAKRTVTVTLGRGAEKPEEGAAISVACSLPKQLRMAEVVETLTELGVKAIFPVVTDRTVPKVKETEKKLLRFRRIALEAAKQCGASRLPEIPGIFSFTEILSKRGAYDLALFLAPRGRPLQEILEGRRAVKILVAVGPEGGWSEREIASAEAARWERVSLGQRILKVDTACSATVSILHYALEPLARACSSVG